MTRTKTIILAGLYGLLITALAFCATTPEVEKDNRTVVLRVFNEAWNQQKLDVILGKAEGF